MQDLPFKDPLILALLCVVGMAACVIAGYGAVLVLGWAFGLPMAKHSRLGSVEEVLPLRGRWLGCAITAVVVLVAGPMLLLSIGLFIACLTGLVSLIFNRH